MKRKTFFIVSFFVGCALLLSFLCLCQEKQNAGTPGENMPPSDAALTEEEAVRFAKILEETLQNGDPAFFIRAIDWSTLTNRVLEGIPQEVRGNRFDRRYLIHLFSEKGGIAQSVAEKVKEGGTYHFLRVRKLDSRTIAATFRLVDTQGGLDYHDLYLRRQGENLIQIHELYLYHFDETFSETLRRTLVPDLYVDGKDDYGMMMSERILLLFKENQLLIQEFSKAVEEKNAETALYLFSRLPRELQDQKTFQFWYLKAAQAHTDPNIYAFALAELREKYLKESWVDFLSLDYFFNHREYRQALECVDRIDERVGGDPYLENFRCWAFLNLRQFEKAEEHFQLGLKQEPELIRDRSFQSLKYRLEHLPKGPFPENMPNVPVQAAPPAAVPASGVPVKPTPTNPFDLAK